VCPAYRFNDSNYLNLQVIGIVLTHLFINDIKDRIDKMYEDEGFENRPPKPAGPSQATGFL
jgi:hypothetical protein